MAELILNDAETAALSWLDLSDADLGKLCRKCILDMPEVFGDKDNSKRLWAFNAGLLICKVAAESNSTTLEFEGHGIKVGGRDFGDWRVSVRQISKSKRGGK